MALRRSRMQRHPELHVAWGLFEIDPQGRPTRRIESLQESVEAHDPLPPRDRHSSGAPVPETARGLRRSGAPGQSLCMTRGVFHDRSRRRANLRSVSLGRDARFLVRGGAGS